MIIARTGSGISFLQNERNGFLAKGEDRVLRRILGSGRQRKA